jgi:hypothetical protein
MIWHLATIAMPTPEIIHTAWTMGLEYNVGTSSMGLNAMTALAETAGFRPGDLFRKPPETKFPEEYKIPGHALENQVSMYAPPQDEPEEEEEVPQHQGRTGRAAAKKKKNWRPGRPQEFGRSQGMDFYADASQGGAVLPEYNRLLVSGDRRSRITPNQLSKLHNQFHTTLFALNHYRYQVSHSSAQAMLFADPARIVDEVCGAKTMNLDVEKEPPRPPPPIDGEDDDDLDGFELGRRMAQRGDGPPSPGSGQDIHRGYHETNAEINPGPGNCLMNCVSAEDRMTCPYCRGQDFAGAPSAPVAGAPSLPYSAVMPAALSLGMFYKPQDLLQWCCGEAAALDNAKAPKTGVRSDINYAKKPPGVGGAQRLDYAWVEVPGADTWFGLAARVHEGRTNGDSSTSCSRTAQMFDYHIDGLRDVFYLMSTKDNARRLPLDPAYVAEKHPENVMMDSSGQPVTKDTLLVRPKKMRMGAFGDYLAPGAEAPPRHPDAHVPDTVFQRRCDLLLRGGALPAANVIVSNRVVNTAPLRLYNECVQINTGALHDHILLLADAVSMLGAVPGLQNLQEKFCNDATGPDGFSSKKKGGGKERRERDEDEEEVHTLPYSYDLISMSISVNMIMFYNDVGPLAVEAMNSMYGESHGMRLETDDLPDLSLRFLGFNEEERQTITIPLPTQRPEGQKHVEAGDPSLESSGVSLDHVSSSLGRPATEQDLADYIGRRQGSRAMRGVTGDLFAVSTWLKHAIQSLVDRGLIEGRADEPAVVSLTNMTTCVNARVMEHASAKNLDVQWPVAKAEPRTYKAQRERRLQAASRASAAAPPKKQKLASSTHMVPLAHLVAHTPGGVPRPDRGSSSASARA